MSVDSLPPDIGRMLREIKRRLYALERRRLPAASPARMYLFAGLGSQSGFAPGTGEGNICAFDFTLPFDAYVVATATVLENAQTFATGIVSDLAAFSSSVDVSLDGNTNLFSAGTFGGFGMDNGSGDMSPEANRNWSIAVQAQRLLAAGTHTVSVNGSMSGALLSVNAAADIVVVGYPVATTVFENPDGSPSA